MMPQQRAVPPVLPPAGPGRAPGLAQVSPPVPEAIGAGMLRQPPPGGAGVFAARPAPVELSVPVEVLLPGQGLVEVLRPGPVQPGVLLPVSVRVLPVYFPAAPKQRWPESLPLPVSQG